MPLNDAAVSVGRVNTPGRMRHTCASGARYQLSLKQKHGNSIVCADLECRYLREELLVRGRDDVFAVRRCSVADCKEALGQWHHLAREECDLRQFRGLICCIDFSDL